MFNQDKIMREPNVSEDIHNCLSELQGVEITKVDTILNQVIWNNQFITIPKMPFRWEKLIQHNIMSIKDLLSDNSNLLSQQEINDKYNVGCNFFNILQLRQSIQFSLREAIHGTYVKNIHINRNNITLTDQNGNVLDIRHVNCKMIYRIFESKKLRQPSCINKWTIGYPKFENVEQTLWKNIFCSAFHITWQTKLQSFQYRILHRTITCRKKLYDMKLVDSPNCLYWNNIDDIRL